MIYNEYFKSIIKKEIKKAIIDELYKKELIDFNQYSFIKQKISNEIFSKQSEIKNVNPMIVDVLI